MQHWLHQGPKKLTIDDEIDFCCEDIAKNILNAKTARTRCNPYETIRGALFLNRAAVKIANIDRACNFMFKVTKCLINQKVWVRMSCYILRSLMLSFLMLSFLHDKFSSTIMTQEFLRNN